MKTQPTGDQAEGRGKRAEGRGQGTEIRGQRSGASPHDAPRSPRSPLRAFTLIEMLAVVSIMAILAALIFPIAGAVKKSQIRTRARGEMAQIETAIHAYNDKFGHYPPDSGAPCIVNQLFYELLGTTNSGSLYQTLDGSAQIVAANVSGVFGSGVSGFINCSRATGGDEAPTGMAFLKGIKPAQWLTVTNGTSSLQFTVLGVSIPGPILLSTGGSDPKSINPWRYNSSSPTNNPKSFDLWIDVMVGGKTNRICNWSDKPIVVGP